MTAIDEQEVRQRGNDDEDDATSSAINGVFFWEVK